MTAQAPKDARTWAMIAHLAAFVGFVGPLIVWLVKREESRFVAFHAKQALWLHIFVAIAALVLVVPVVTIPAAILLPLAALAYSIYGAIQVSGGKDFEYWWVGPWVRRTMM